MILKDLGDTLEVKPQYLCVKGVLTLMLSFQLVGGELAKGVNEKYKNISKKRQMNKVVTSGKHKTQKN